MVYVVLGALCRSSLQEFQVSQTSLAWGTLFKFAALSNDFPPYGAAVLRSEWKKCALYRAVDHEWVIKVEIILHL